MILPSLCVAYVKYLDSDPDDLNGLLTLWDSEQSVRSCSKETVEKLNARLEKKGERELGRAKRLLSQLRDFLFDLNCVHAPTQNTGTGITPNQMYIVTNVSWRDPEMRSNIYLRPPSAVLVFGESRPLLFHRHVEEHCHLYLWLTFRAVIRLGCTLFVVSRLL